MMTTATGVFVTALVFVLSCSTCVASPVNESVRYECLTNDDCRTGNITDYSRIQGNLYCCRSGDVIELSFKDDGYGIVSSFFGFSDYTASSSYIEDNSDTPSNESSEDSDERRSESRGSDPSSDQSGNSGRRESNGNVTCTCKQVDVEKIRNRFNDYFRRMYQSLESWFSRLSWR